MVKKPSRVVKRLLGYMLDTDPHWVVETLIDKLSPGDNRFTSNSLIN